MVLIDTNIIIRLITQTPKNQYEEAKDFFKKLAYREIEAVVLESVSMECFFVLNKVYNIKREDVLKKLKYILEFENIVNKDKYILIETLNLMSKKNIDFVDALLCVKSQIDSIEIFSFDKDIKKCKK